MTQTDLDPAMLADRVRAEEQAAHARLTEAANHSSLCALSRSGSPQPAAKYHEGAAAGLADARRALLRGDLRDEAAHRAIEKIRSNWAARRSSTGVSASPDWRAYIEGGIDALDGILLSRAENATRAFSAPLTLALEQSLPAGKPVRPIEVVAPPTPRPAGPMGLVRDALGARRRLITMAAVAPALFASLNAAAGHGAPASWLVAVAAFSLIAGAVLATYVPEQGWRPNVGCYPCAVVSVGSVIVGVSLVTGAPHVLSSAILALGVVTLGMWQRLTGTGPSCPA